MEIQAQRDQWPDRVFRCSHTAGRMDDIEQGVLDRFLEKILERGGEASEAELERMRQIDKGGRIPKDFRARGGDDDW